MSESETFDLVVVGSGPAGEKGAAQAAYFGKRVALVERAEEPGGAAVHTGTLPSKTLRETALFLSGYRQTELYGLTVELKQDLAVVVSAEALFTLTDLCLLSPEAAIASAVRCARTLTAAAISEHPA